MKHTIQTLFCLTAFVLCAVSARASRVDTIIFRGDSSHILQRVCVYTVPWLNPRYVSSL